MPCRQFCHRDSKTSHYNIDQRRNDDDQSKQQNSCWHLNLSCHGLEKVPCVAFAVAGPIVSVTLNNNRLTDLPDELIQLKDTILRLELSGNNFTTLPNVVTALSHLEILHFSNNQLQQIPTSLSQLKQLTTLHLSGNHMKQVPKVICELVQLRRLYLDHNQIEHVHQEFGKLRNLEVLHLQTNKIRSLPTSLAELHALTEFDCSDNPLIQPPLNICRQSVVVVQSYLKMQQIDSQDGGPSLSAMTTIGQIRAKRSYYETSGKNAISTCGRSKIFKNTSQTSNDPNRESKSTLTSDDEAVHNDRCKSTTGGGSNHNNLQQTFEPSGGSGGNNARPTGKMRLRPWLEEKISAQAIPGLCWIDKENKIFRIPWKHAARQGWSVDEDASLFRAWAVHTGKFTPGRDEPRPKVWKANFRCALNSLHDVEQITEDSITKGNDAVKVYRFLDGGKRKGDLSDPVYKNVIKKLRLEETSSIANKHELSAIKAEKGIDIKDANNLIISKSNESIIIDSKGGCYFFEDKGLCIRVGQNAIKDQVPVSCTLINDTSYPRQDDEIVFGHIFTFNIPLARFAEPVTICLPHRGFINRDKQEIIVKYWSDADKKWHECEEIDVSELAKKIIVNKQQLFVSYVGCKTTSLTSFVVVCRTRSSRASFCSSGGRLSSHYSKDVYVQVPERTFPSVTELMLQVSPIESDVANVWVSQESKISPFVTLKCNKSTLTGPVTLSIPFTTECLNDTAFAASALISLSLQQSPKSILKDDNKGQNRKIDGSIGITDASISKKGSNIETEKKGDLKIICKKLKESEWQEITEEVKPSMKLTTDSICFETKKQATYLIAFTKNSKDLTNNAVKSMYNRVCVPLVRMSVFYREMNNSYQIFVLCSSDCVIREVTQEFEKKMDAKCIYNSNLLKMTYGETCSIRFRGNLTPASGTVSDDLKLVYKPYQLQIKHFGLACVDGSHPLNGFIAFESLSDNIRRTLWSCEISFNTNVSSSSPTKSTSSSARTAPVATTTALTSGTSSKSSTESKIAWPVYSTPRFSLDTTRSDNHPTMPIYVQPYPQLTIPSTTTAGSVAASGLGLNSQLMQSQALTLIQQNAAAAYGVHTPIILPTHGYPHLNYNPTVVNVPQPLLHHAVLPSITGDSIPYQSHIAGLMPLPYAAIQRPVLGLRVFLAELLNEKAWPEVAKKLSGKWHDLATYLNVNMNEMNQLDRCVTSEEKVTKVMQLWRQRAATMSAEKAWEELQQALKKCGIQVHDLLPVIK